MLSTMELIKGSKVFEAITAAEWDALAVQGMTDTPFQRYAYQKAWWTHLGPGELYTIIVREDDTGKLTGIAPFYIQNGVVQFNGSKEETDYLDIIAAEQNAEAVWTAVFDCLCSSDFPTWQSVDLHCLPAASPSLEIVPRLVASRGFILSQNGVCEVCPVIPLEGSFEDYLMNIDKKQRHEIRRKLRRADGADATLEIIGPDDDLHAAVDEFLELLQKSSPDKEEWLSEGRTAVFHEVAEAAMQAEMLQLMFMRINGERCAALFNFIYNGRTWVYNSGLDMSKHSHLSLGVVLTSYAIEYAAERGFQTFDFLRGDETYKYRFGAQDTEIYQLTIQKE